jgi:excisionase family DNA binding protein
MTISELARKLGKSRGTIYNWIRSGKVKVRRDFGGEQYISKHEAERLIGERDAYDIDHPAVVCQVPEKSLSLPVSQSQDGEV